MLDNNHGIVVVTKFAQGINQAAVVSLVQSNARLIKDIKDIHELRTDLGGKADALGFPTGQSKRLAVEGKIFQPHIEQEAKAGTDFLQDFPGNAFLRRFEFILKGTYPIVEVAQFHLRQFGNILAVDAVTQGFLREALPVAEVAFHLGDKLLRPFGCFFGSGILALEDNVFDDAFEGIESVGRNAQRFFREAYLTGITIEDIGKGFFGELADGSVQVTTVHLQDSLDLPEKHGVLVFPQRLDAPVINRKAVVGNNLVDINSTDNTHAFALRASPLGGIKRKGMGSRVAIGNARVGTHQVAAVVFQLAGIGIHDHQGAFPMLHRSGKGRLEAPQVHVVANDDFVYQDFNVVNLVTVDTHARTDFLQLAVHAHREEPLAAKAFKKLFIVSLAGFDHGGKQEDALVFEMLSQELHDFLVGVLDHAAAGKVRICLARPRIEEAKEIVDFGRGAHCRTGIFIGRLLFDGNHRAQTCDFVHIGTLHVAQKLAGIGGEGLHITPLPLGINRVKRQRRLAAAAQPSDDNQTVARNGQVDVLQIMLACPVNGNLSFLVLYIFHGSCSSKRMQR